MLIVPVCVHPAGQVVYAHQFVNLTGENLTDSSLFEEHLCSVLCDLTGLAIGKYSKVGGWPPPLSAFSLHLCVCNNSNRLLLCYFPSVCDVCSLFSSEECCFIFFHLTLSI